MASCLAVASDISGYWPIVYFLILPLILILQRKVLLFGRILTIRLGVLSSLIISSFVSCGRVIAFSWLSVVKLLIFIWVSFLGFGYLRGYPFGYPFE